MLITCCLARYIRMKMMSDSPLVTSASGGVTKVVNLWQKSVASTKCRLTGYTGYTGIGLFESSSGAVVSMVLFIIVCSYTVLLQRTQSQRRHVQHER